MKCPFCENEQPEQGAKEHYTCFHCGMVFEPPATLLDNILEIALVLSIIFVIGAALWFFSNFEIVFKILPLG